MLTYHLLGVPSRQCKPKGPSNQQQKGGSGGNLYDEFSSGPNKEHGVTWWKFIGGRDLAVEPHNSGGP